eukprot:XP_011672129.1 PREDICTED: GTP-binding protein 1-like [Strongylocentrotus purpuratus]
MAAIVTNFLPDSPSQDNLKSPTTPTTPSAPFPGMGECNLFSPEDTLNGDDALIGELNAKDKLVCPSDMVYDAILKQLHERLEEGQGETIYSVGQGGKNSKVF